MIEQTRLGFVICEMKVNGKLSPISLSIDKEGNIDVIPGYGELYPRKFTAIRITKQLNEKAGKNKFIIKKAKLTFWEKTKW